MDQIEYYHRLEALLSAAFEKLPRQKEFSDGWLVKEFIEHGEYGLAIDLMDSYLRDGNLQIPDEIDAAKKLIAMGYEI